MSLFEVHTFSDGEGWSVQGEYEDREDAIGTAHLVVTVPGGDVLRARVTRDDLIEAAFARGADTRDPRKPREVTGCHPWCRECGWRQGGGADSWSGSACKCGKSGSAVHRVATGGASCVDCGAVVEAEVAS